MEESMVTPVTRIRLPSRMPLMFLLVENWVEKLGVESWG
jgi:hypothetical protein